MRHPIQRSFTGKTVQPVSSHEAGHDIIEDDLKGGSPPAAAARRLARNPARRLATVTLRVAGGCPGGPPVPLASGQATASTCRRWLATRAVVPVGWLLGLGLEALLRVIDEWACGCQPVDGASDQRRVITLGRTYLAH